MPATKLTTIRVEKPWGRHTLWPGFSDPAPDGDPVGEIWFQTPGEAQPDLLVKYLFTNEKLSVQVHPNDEQARAVGHARGKDEAWIILAAESDSTIALGTLEPMQSDQLRAAALDGSIEHLLDWKPVKAGDYFYSKAGTVHAIGAGITLIEVQQNVDLTYRLYDYGRPRPLHLDEGVAVSDAKPFVAMPQPGMIEDGRELLAEGPKFVLERWRGGRRAVCLPVGMTAWLIPAIGSGCVGDLMWVAGDCLTLTGDNIVEAAEQSELYFAYPGDQRITLR